VVPTSDEDGSFAKPNGESAEEEDDNVDNVVIDNTEVNL
jgi:hypothetical protein